MDADQQVGLADRAADAREATSLLPVAAAPAALDDRAAVRDGEAARVGAQRSLATMTGAPSAATPFTGAPSAAPPPMRLGEGIAALLERMTVDLAQMQGSDDPARFFLATYRRTTQEVARRLEHGGFVDRAWVERWDLAFAGLYLDALETSRAGGRVSRPWEEAFAAGRSGPRLPPLRHLLLGMNAHINFDLPQALLRVISDEEFADPQLLALREADHRRIDEVLASRVAAEDGALRTVELPGDRTVLDRLLRPFHHVGTRRFLAESRAKMWRNAFALSRARQQHRLPQRLAELEDLAAAKVRELTAPGQVIVHLTLRGFGVVLPSDS